MRIKIEINKSEKMINIVHLHSLNIKNILKFKRKNKGDYAFIMLNSDVSNVKYCDILKENGVREVKLEKINSDEILLCEKEYIENVGLLSEKYNSLEWWANAVSQKNEYTAFLYKNLCSCYSIINTLEKIKSDDLIIFVISNYEIFSVLKVYCLTQKIKISSINSSIIACFNKIVGCIYAYLKSFYFLFRVLLRKLYISIIIKDNLSKIRTTDNYYVIRTWLDGRFLRDDQEENDSYFGKIAQYAEKNGYKPLFLAGINGHYKKILKQIKKKENVLIIPEEYFLKISAFFNILVSLFFNRIKIKDKVLFMGFDVTAIYQKEATSNALGIGFLYNICEYYIGKSFAECIKFKKYIHTFENYAWEKMMILGLRQKKCKNSQILGFQHAYVSRNSFKYFLGSSEKEIIPLPDKIITMGKITKELLERYGNYNDDIFEVGCALRQEYINNSVIFKRRKFNKLVVPLNMVPEESVLIIRFLYEAGLADTKIKVVIRCHPAYGFKTLKQYIDFKMPSNFIISNQKNVEEELSDTDILIYTWTTVAIEALKLGLPVIYLDILYPMYVSPLFDCKGLNSAVKKPKELIPELEKYYNMEDEVFYKKQQISQEYLKEYFYPVKKENLAVFFQKNKQ